MRTSLRRLPAEEPGDPEVVAEARRRKEAALMDFGTGTGRDGCALPYNPYFFTELDFDGVEFVLFHEARHLVVPAANLTPGRPAGERPRPGRARSP
ncbi:hypothetical protein ACFHW2_02340 [Actinomadura sp. LOL_016]|uniref:hypothetical protein n=1 Tax=unclassified Actinomadura TaxID=2626254 RepID=UPI003A7F9104